MPVRPSPLFRAMLYLPSVVLMGAALLAVGSRGSGPLSGALDAASPKAAQAGNLASLYETPGGLYTLADLRANGSVPPAVKFAGIPSNHHLHPAAGDRICPVTRTKANPRFTWTIHGKSYRFCCPPCIDEFVRKARAAPRSVFPPEAYVQR